jgi:hypothetical protein
VRKRLSVSEPDDMKINVVRDCGKENVPFKLSRPYAGYLENGADG